MSDPPGLANSVASINAKITPEVVFDPWMVFFLGVAKTYTQIAS